MQGHAPPIFFLSGNILFNFGFKFLQDLSGVSPGDLDGEGVVGVLHLVVGVHGLHVRPRWRVDGDFEPGIGWVVDLQKTTTQ